MTISQPELFQKISGALLRLKREDPVQPETAATVSMLENTLNLLGAAALQLNIEEFPASEEDCLALVNDTDSGFSEDDLDELRYLAQSVRWALERVG